MLKQYPVCCTVLVCRGVCVLVCVGIYGCVCVLVSYVVGTSMNSTRYRGSPPSHLLRFAVGNVYVCMYVRHAGMLEGGSTKASYSREQPEAV